MIVISAMTMHQSDELAKLRKATVDNVEHYAHDEAIEDAKVGTLMALLFSHDFAALLCK